VSESLKEKTQDFLHEFFVKGQELVRDLIDENERLRSRLAAVEPAGGGESVVDALMARVRALESEITELRRLAGAVRQDSGGYRGRMESLEREHYHLAARYVAANQFHASATLDDVLRTSTEILLNFVGVGRFTLFGVDEERQVLFPLAVEGGSSEGGGDGSSAEGVAELALAASGEAQSAARGRRPWREGDDLHGVPGVLAHLPLVSGTRLIGLARLESFLPQKDAFEDTDYGLLELISEHAGIAIETAWMKANAKDLPMQRQAIEHLVGA
jgi:GAF domain-containing protein